MAHATSVDSISNFENLLQRDGLRIVSVDCVGDLEIGSFLLADCKQIVAVGLRGEEVFMSCSLKYARRNIGEFVFTQLHAAVFNEKSILSILDGLMLDLFMRSFPSSRDDIRDGVRFVERSRFLEKRLPKVLSTKPKFELRVTRKVRL